MGLNVVILAAGKGKRMMSSKPKVMHELGGIPMLERVVNTAKSLDPKNIFVVYGNGGSIVREDMDYLPVEWVEQSEQLGTGHAVLQAIPNLDDKDKVLVLYGDVPLISKETLEHLLKDTPYNGLGLMVTELEDPTGFGRIIRNEVGNIVAIVEHKDANANQLKINEINTGILTTTAKHLKKWLPALKNENKQQEYYLTDIVALAVSRGVPVGGVLIRQWEEVQGVNDRWQLAKLERYFQFSSARRLAFSGVTVRDPMRLYIRGEVDIQQDVELDLNVILEGKVRIGSNSKIGANVMLKDVEIGEGVEILPNSMIEGAKIASGATIGPFARIRPGTTIDENAKIGNFVEVKKTHVGKSSKASHLTYLGDTHIGENVNIGAGTITCNYDGVNKFKTVIEDGAFIGSNASLVAPIKIGKNATVGAGSTVSKEAPDNELTVSRAKQTTIKGWKRPT